MSLAKAIPKVIAGSAMAGIGLSLGRDIYKSSKNNNGLIFAVIFLVLSVWLYIQSWTWLFRNYKTTAGSIFARVFSLPTLLLGAIFTAFSLWVLGALIGMIFIDEEAQNPLMIYTVAYWIAENILLPLTNSIFWLLGGTGSDEILTPQNEQLTRDQLAASFAVFGIVLFPYIGIKRGLKQRKAREQAWEAELHNMLFMNEIGLQEVGDKQFVDEEGNRYRLENELRNMIELFPLGRRNRRAYLEFDETGKFTNWTGIVKI
ncbi:hypothetical protein [Pseudidiomarina marina]|uniref:Uncharacterized protein n=1 Tax=Pseudidiomarina marina TaxID=502366 RepID=A0A432YCI0_9GAMM|nr:hypothetical protein [Pseudidiomarina marina]RUO58664.1 hypothetical protein CWI76_11105 [Pseudidiomarina marina]